MHALSLRQSLLSLVLLLAGPAGCQAELTFYDLDMDGQSDTVATSDTEVDTGPPSICPDCPAASSTCCADPTNPTVGVCMSNESMLIDNGNCGACGNTCAAGQHCSGGGCGCDVEGLTACDESCVDIANDTSHCGACSTTCAESELCISGQCIIDCNLMDIPAASAHPCGSADICLTQLGRLEPGTDVVWTVGATGDIPPDNYREIHAEIQVCHGGWLDTSANHEHGLLWVAVGEPDANPQETLADVWAEPCGDGSCAGKVSAKFEWGAEKKTATTPPTVSVEPGAIYGIAMTYKPWLLDVELERSDGSVAATLSLSNSETLIPLAEGQAIHTMLGYRGVNDTRPELASWLFYNVQLHLVPYDAPPGG